MKKVISIIFLIAFLSGCGANSPYGAWRSLKFTTPPDKTDQARVMAQEDCIKQVDADDSSTGATILFGIAGQYTVKSKQYQKCMDEKGYPCVDDLYECPYKPEKK